MSYHPVPVISVCFDKDSLMTDAWKCDIVKTNRLTRVIQLEYKLLWNYRWANKKT